MNKQNNDMIEALLFDLGGVIVEIDFDRAFKVWAKYSNSNIEEIKSRFTFDEYYEAHERGEIEFDQYFNSLRKTLGIEITDQEFTVGWNSIFIGEIAGISKLLSNIKTIIPIYVFSNTNKLHQNYWFKQFENILSNFETIFTSSDIGKRKPDLDAFQTVADLIGFKPQQILFFDDLLENINGAKKAGFKTVHVQSVLDTEIGVKQIINPNNE